MIRWAALFLAISAVLAPLAFSDLGRQFMHEAKLLVGVGLVAAATLALVAFRRRPG